MTVLVKDRKSTPIDFYYNALVLRKHITELLLQDFGVKDKIRSYKSVSNISKMDNQDRLEFSRLCEKYKIATLEEEFPSWLLNTFRTNIMNIMTSMVKNIVAGHNIRLSLERRKNAQEGAYIACKHLLEEMQYVIDVVPVNINRYIRLTNEIEVEMNLLEKWLLKPRTPLKKVN